ncbi:MULTISPECIES: sulfur transferase domain-containing protein [unclassified Xanthomonas]|uniref:fused DSP-PTPase phosphatase/NAD kinase-like protein n=2 Tax=Xanthomonas TaxID=338 RepID=UPI002882DF1F|nr:MULTISPECIES: sulfur transferase domain-containing protein [unclassified Xanthomonas]
MMLQCLRHAAWCIALLSGAALAQTTPTGTTRNLISSGQPTQAHLRAAATQGVTTVIDLRAPEEPRGYDEIAAADALGLRYVRLPIRNADALTPEAARALQRVLNQQQQGTVLLHCASGNRAGALLALLAAREGASPEQALQIGREAGMQPSLEAAVRKQLGVEPQR